MAIRKRLSALLAAGVALAIAAGPARAEYPDRAINVTVGFAPGGTSDVAARFLGERLTPGQWAAGLFLILGCILLIRARFAMRT